MNKLKFFDCNCSIGRVANPLLYDIHDVDGLLREMDVAGVGQALVYHTLARDGHAVSGNSRLMSLIKDSTRLFPVWVVFPHYTGEFPEPESLLEEMAKNQVVAVRLFPGRDHHGFSLSSWCSGELFSALEVHRIPVFLDIEIVSWDAVYTILKTCPNLPLIISNCSYRHNRFSYPLLKTFRNLYIELSRYFGAGAVEDFVAHFGGSRLLFGSNMPLYSATAPVALLTYADLPGKVKAAIAGENLKNLIAQIGL